MKKQINAVSLLTLSAVLASSVATAAASQLPTGYNAHLSTGVQSVHTNGNTQTIRTNANRSLGSFNTFSIGHGKTVNVHQPTNSSIFMAQVRKAGAPSSIHGHLNSNGAVGILNSAGVFVGPNGVVNTRGGFLASTQDLDKQWYFMGKDFFVVGNGSEALVENKGTIKVGSEGFVLLHGKKVRNEGTITAPNGSVSLASTSQIRLQTPDGIRFTFDQNDAKGLFNHKTGFVMNSGKVDVSAVGHNTKGEIVLVSDGGWVKDSGHLKAAGTRGYNVFLKGKDVWKTGGTIATDGGMQLVATNAVSVHNSQLFSNFENIELQGKQRVTVDSHSRLHSDTCDVNLWSEHGNIFNHGDISTKRGFIRLTAKKNVYHGKQASAHAGEYGQLLVSSGHNIFADGAMGTQHGQLSLNAGYDLHQNNTIQSHSGNIVLHAGHKLLAKGKVQTGGHGAIKVTTHDAVHKNGQFVTENGDIHVVANNGIFDSGKNLSHTGDITLMTRKRSVHLGGLTQTAGDIVACSTDRHGNVYVNGTVQAKNHGTVSLLANSKVSTGRHSQVLSDKGDITISGGRKIHIGNKVLSNAGDITFNTSGSIHRSHGSQIKSNHGHVAFNTNVPVRID